MSTGKLFIKQRHRNISITRGDILVKITGYGALTLIIILMLIGIYLQT